MKRRSDEAPAEVRKKKEESDDDDGCKRGMYLDARRPRHALVTLR